MLHVFISYAHEDGDDYRITLMDELKKEGFTDEDFWYDKRDIEPGEDWRTAIDRGLQESFIVLIILTPVAVKRHYVT